MASGSEGWNVGVGLPPPPPREYHRREADTLDISSRRRETRVGSVRTHQATSGDAMESLNGKVAVVTGGASGIGRALVLAFAREGARVVVADLDDAGMADTVAEVARAGSAAIAIRTDVSRLEQVQALADRAFAEMGAVHVLCNNAGVALWGGLESATHRDWEWAI